MSYNAYEEWITQTLPVSCHCLPVHLPSCVNTFYLPTIYPQQQLLLYFVDKFDKEYVYLAATDEQGWIKVDTKWFPPGLFNPYAGVFTVFFTFSLDKKGDRRYFRSDKEVYPCLNITVVDYVYTNIEQYSEHYVDTSVYYCCCERSCPLPIPDCNSPDTVTF